MELSEGVVFSAGVLLSAGVELSAGAAFSSVFGEVEVSSDAGVVLS